MAKFVDTAGMATTISSIESNIDEIKKAIDNYSAKAPSLGSSSFLGTVESNLNKIKNTYASDLTPSLDAILENVNKVKEEYDLRNTDIENAAM